MDEKPPSTLGAGHELPGATLSGTQFHISHREHHATITEVGANLRAYAVGGRDVLTPFAAGRC